MFNCPFCKELRTIIVHADGEEITEYFCKCRFFSIYMHPSEKHAMIRLQAFGSVDEYGDIDIYSLFVTHDKFDYTFNDDVIEGFDSAVDAYEDILKMRTLEVLIR